MLNVSKWFFLSSQKLCGIKYLISFNWSAIIISSNVWLTRVALFALLIDVDCKRFSILKFGRRLKPIERSHEQIWAHTRDWKVYEDRSTNLVRHFDVVECEVKSLRFMFRKFFWPFVARTREEWKKFIERSFGQWTDKRLKCLKKSNKCRCNLKMVMRELNWLKDLGFGINAV